VSPDGRYLATGHDGGSIALWDTRKGVLAAVTDTGTTDLRGLSFSPDNSRGGSQLLAGGHMGHALVYSVNKLIEEAGVLRKLEKSRVKIIPGSR
jgi:WD40 repeat protein